MNVILIFLAVYSIIDIIGEDNIIKIIFKSIISFLSFIPVFVSFYFLLKNKNFKTLYIVQQTMIYINENWANEMIKRVNILKGYDYEDNLIKRKFIDHKYNIIINPKKLCINLKHDKSIYLDKYHFVIKGGNLVFKNLIEKGELIEEDNLFFITSDKYKIRLFYQKIKIFEKLFHCYIIDIPTEIKKDCNSYLIYCNPHNNIEDVESFLINDFYYIENMPGKFYDGTIHRMDIKDKILYLNLTNYLERKDKEYNNEFIEIADKYILKKTKYNRITRIYNVDMEFSYGHYWL
jgi:hypothetical protein